MILKYLQLHVLFFGFGIWVKYCIHAVLLTYFTFNVHLFVLNNNIQVC